MKIKFKKWKCEIVNVGEYSNGRIALELVDKNGDMIADVTINIPETHLNEGEIIVKDYSENEGMYETLLAAGVISKIKRRAFSGYITAPIVDLLVKF